MGFRIQQLEEALAVFQSGISSEPHPLLRDDLLRIKFAPRKHRTVAKEKSRENSSGTTDAPGISTVGDWQDLKYYDLSAARTEVCLLLIKEAYLSNLHLSKFMVEFFISAGTNEVD